MISKQTQIKPIVEINQSGNQKLHLLIYLLFFNLVTLFI